MKVLLFDVDNTLYPEETNLFALVDRKINDYLKFFVKINPEKVNFIRKKYLIEYGTTLNGLIKHYNVDPLHYLEYVHNVPLEKYIKKNIKLEKFLKTTQHKKVIFSNAYKPYILKILTLLNISDCFEYIIDIVESDFHPKPIKSSYLKIMNMFSVKPSDFVMFDDSVINLKTAHELGFKTVLVGKRKGDRLNQFDYSISKIHEISDIIK
jgi:putative hydrolase of the HAD superfamily